MLRNYGVPLVCGLGDKVPEGFAQVDFKGSVVNLLHVLNEVESAYPRLDDAFGRILPPVDGVDYMVNVERSSVVPLLQVGVYFEGECFDVVADFPGLRHVGPDLDAVARRELQQSAVHSAAVVEQRNPSACLGEVPFWRECAIDYADVSAAYRFVARHGGWRLRGRCGGNRGWHNRGRESRRGRGLGCGRRSLGIVGRRAGTRQADDRRNRQ